MAERPHMDILDEDIDVGKGKVTIHFVLCYAPRKLDPNMLRGIKGAKLENLGVHATRHHGAGNKYRLTVHGDQIRCGAVQRYILATARGETQDAQKFRRLAMETPPDSTQPLPLGTAQINMPYSASYRRSLHL